MQLQQLPQRHTLKCTEAPGMLIVEELLRFPRRKALNHPPSILRLALYVKRRLAGKSANNSKSGVYPELLSGRPRPPRFPRLRLLPFTLSVAGFTLSNADSVRHLHAPLASATMESHDNPRLQSLSGTRRGLRRLRRGLPLHPRLLLSGQDRARSPRQYP